jgi:hypothetical protein
MPEDDRQWVVDAAKSVPGVRDALAPTSETIYRVIRSG